MSHTPHWKGLLLLADSLTRTLPEFTGVLTVNTPDTLDNEVERAVVAHLRLTRLLIQRTVQWTSQAAESGDQEAAEYLRNENWEPAALGQPQGRAADGDVVEQCESAVDSIRADVSVICDKLEEFGSALPPALAAEWPTRNVTSLRRSLDGLWDGPNG